MSAAPSTIATEFAQRAELMAALSLADPSAPESGQPSLEATERAYELARALGDPRSEALAAGWRCVHLFRRGRQAEVVQQARQALTLLHAQQLDIEQRELLRVLALAANETARFDLAIEAAQELVQLAAAADEPGASLTATFVLAACLERMGDSWQALRVLADALADAPTAPERERLIALNGMAAMGIGLFHRLRDLASSEESRRQLDMARAHALEARAMLRRVDDPVYAVTVQGNLGEVLTYLGELDEGGQLLHAALADGQALSLHAHVWRITASIGEWLHASGRHEEAVRRMQQLLAELGPDGPGQTQIRAHGAAYRAHKALGRHEQALRHFEAAEWMERQRTISQLQSQSRLFVTRSEVERARRDAQRQRARAAEFAQHAVRDPLTGIGNRRHLDQQFTGLVEEAERLQRPLAVALLDVDHFKQINDSHGHQMGDRVLVALAQLLAENVRSHDVLARMGGEEFVIVLPDMAHERAMEVCARLAERIRSHSWPPGGPARVTVSIGVAGCSAGQPADPVELLQRADEALYEAKRCGRDRVMAK